MFVLIGKDVCEPLPRTGSLAQNETVIIDRFA